MNENNTSNITTGIPATTGGIKIAPIGTALPTDATTALDKAFVNLGYISEDGVTVTIERETEETKSWGGTVVANNQTSYKETYKMSLLETLNLDVLKFAYGSGNVSGSDFKTGVTITGNSKPLANKVIVIETVTSDGFLKRTVIPKGSPTVSGDIVLKDNEVIAFEVEITALADSSGNAHYDYIKDTTTGGIGG